MKKRVTCKVDTNKLLNSVSTNDQDIRLLTPSEAVYRLFAVNWINKIVSSPVFPDRYFLVISKNEDRYLNGYFNYTAKEIDLQTRESIKDKYQNEIFVSLSSLDMNEEGGKSSG